MNKESASKVHTQTRRHRHIRLIIQLAAAALLNGYAAGFAKGRIFTGKTKMLCVPVLNCYSCPGALGSCPIGALQTMIGRRHGRFPFYVLGTLMLFGLVFGRLLCGFICPFGLLQDLFYKIPVRKVRVAPRIDRPARYIKYGSLLILCILLPLFVRGDLGVSAPFFCQYVCPAGTLEGGIPMLLKNPSLRALTGELFTWKTALLLFFVIGSVVISRFFCRYFCPLGAFYALFNRFSLYQMNVSPSKCTGCGTCDKVCPMGIHVCAAKTNYTNTLTNAECIRCGKCKAACPAQAITSGFHLKA